MENAFWPFPLSEASLEAHAFDGTIFSPTKAVISFSPAHFLSFSADCRSWLTILLPTPAYAILHDFNIHRMTHPLPPSTLRSSPPLLSAPGFQGHTLNVVTTRNRAIPECRLP